MKKFSAYSFLSLATLLIILTFSFCNKKKNLAGDEFVGEWTNNGSTNLSITDKKQGSYIKSSGGSRETATGPVKVSGSELKVGVKKFLLGAYPTEKIQGAVKNTYIVLDDDTLFKKPFTKPPVDFCKDGIWNNNEDGVDCGGTCKPCETCYDGIKNQDETDIDCGGTNCNACTCEDGKKNQGEQGIDCGAVCEPCNTNACNTAAGYAEHFYVWETGKHSAICNLIYADSTFHAFKPQVNIELDFSEFVFGYSAYNILFYNNAFITMPVNDTQVFTTDYYDPGNPANKCYVSLRNSNRSSYALNKQKVYVKRVSASVYNVKFCNLITTEKFQTDSMRMSLNTDFSFYR